MLMVQKAMGASSFSLKGSHCMCWHNDAILFSQSLPFGGVKESGFGRFAGIEGLRACCLVKSVVEDRWWPYIKTKIPKPIQVSFVIFTSIL